jgi:hypothetical protein
MSENTMNITSISTELSRPDQNSSISNENDEESDIIQLYEKNGFLTFEGDDGLPTPPYFFYFKLHYNFFN